ncbi:MULTISPECIES: hypothetical protein [Paenibacillus]|uniref:hypothetical protein n=1 Tax=Paenibacillus TaxID=44249 RepID=UPI0022B8B77C|nr:hypothetical protein [Paenibacillus caseinilyticus]MCZ8520030.1 hypothetical protein [Paenibacillus caseinilyticus]
MIGSLRWNLYAGLAAFLITFVLSIPNNIWLTTIVRSCYSFIVLFLLVFGCRWLLGTIAGLNGLPAPQPSVMPAAPPAEEEGKGSAYDAMTPDQDAELHQMLKGSMSGTAPPEPGFAPLTPPKLSTKVQPTPEELAQAVRQMSEE